MMYWYDDLSSQWLHLFSRNLIRSLRVEALSIGASPLYYHPTELRSAKRT